MNKTKYTCHAVVNSNLIEDTVVAVSDKQAWFIFCSRHGYKNRDFKIIGRQSVGPQQLSMF